MVPGRCSPAVADVNTLVRRTAGQTMSTLPRPRLRARLFRYPTQTVTRLSPLGQIPRQHSI
jgi:hypothetical protein